MKYLLFLLCICITLEISAQEIEFEKSMVSPSILKLVDRIAKVNEIHSSGISISGERTAQYDRFVELKKKATKAELHILTSHPNATVRGYSFWALTSKKEQQLFDIIKATLADTTRVTTFFGCIIDQPLLVDFYIDLVTYEYERGASRLNSAQRKELDSLLLFQDTQSSWRSRLLSELEPLPNYYDRIRSIALSGKTPTAYVALAKYQKEQDLEIIKPLIYSRRLDYYGMQAVREFPHPSFLKDLKDIHDKEIRKSGGFDYPMIATMYEAIAHYDAEVAREMFLKTIKEGHPTALNYHAPDIVIAISKYPNLGFNDIKDQIKLDDYQQQKVKESIKRK